MRVSWALKKVEIPMDIVVLMVAGLAMLIAGLLLFPVYAGKLPYYENGLYGLLIFIFALQIVVLGKTPFGDISERTLPLLIFGILIACVGIVTCYVPDILKNIPRIILFLCFGPGGLFLLLRMFMSKSYFKLWKNEGGILLKLAFNCAAVYSFSIFISVLLVKGDIVSGSATAILLLLYGMLLLSLCFVLYRVYEVYPESIREIGGKIKLSNERAFMLTVGVLTVLLGILLIPIKLGMLPFSGRAQLGLLVVIISLKMMAFGNTPLGAFARTWSLVSLGLIFASMGIISCIVPEIMLPCLTLIIALLDIVGGTIPISRKLFSLRKREANRPRLPAILTKLTVTQTTISTLSIVFGTSMLIRNLIPGPMLGILLTANGVLLLYLLSLLLKIDKINAE
jgi:hypothetical protein